MHLVRQWYNALTMVEGFGMLMSSVHSFSRQLLHSESVTQPLQGIHPQETSDLLLMPYFDQSAYKP